MQNDYKFKAKDFYDLLEQQQYRCPLTNRELTPENTTAEHKVQLSAGGKHEKANIYLIHKDAARLKRHMSEQDMVKLAFDVLKTRGKAHGYSARKF